MDFNNKQTKIIYEFIKKYNSDADFKNNMENIYDNNPKELSILEIYALEVVLRYGNNEIFNKFLQSRGINSVEQAIELFNSFIKLLKEDENFKHYKLEQLKNDKETLSDLEIFAIELVYRDLENKTQENTEKKENNEIEYDELIPIKYDTDKQIRTTIENLLFGKFIHMILELPIMSEIKERQREVGVIATSDKPLIIKEIRKLLEQDIESFTTTVDAVYLKVKFQVLLGNGKDSFGEYLQYKTNISADEIFGREKDSEEEVYQYFKDIVNNIKNSK